MSRYTGQTHLLVAVDCIIFGFDGNDIKLLLIQRGLKPEKGRWSLMGGFLQPRESLEEAASRVLKLSQEHPCAFIVFNIVYWPYFTYV